MANQQLINVAGKVAESKNIYKGVGENISKGIQEGIEGCLSVPGKSGTVTRPFKVTAKATNENGEDFIIEGEELLARAICHELDHLDGKLYTDIAVDMFTED